MYEFYPTGIIVIFITVIEYYSVTNRQNKIEAKDFWTDCSR